MKAVMYGAGNIGRGFIGMLFSASGCEVIFVDVAEKVVKELQKRNNILCAMLPVRGIRM